MERPGAELALFCLTPGLEPVSPPGSRSWMLISTPAELYKTLAAQAQPLKDSGVNGLG